MTRQIVNCEQCVEFSLELLELEHRVRPDEPAELSMAVQARWARSKAWARAATCAARYATALCCLARVTRARLEFYRRDVSGVGHV
jgi:hypothetical protein